MLSINFAFHCVFELNELILVVDASVIEQHELTDFHLAVDVLRFIICYLHICQMQET